MSDDEPSEDYFRDDGASNIVTDHQLSSLMASQSNRELIQLYMGRAHSQSLQTDRGESAPVDDSEDEKERKQRRTDLEGFGENTTEYTEQGQMDLLKEQVHGMQKKKLEIRDKITKFLDSTYDPVVFASISRIITVEILAYHQCVFDRVHSDQAVLAVVSLLKTKEMALLLRTKSAFSQIAEEEGNVYFPEYEPLLKVGLLIIKETITTHHERIKLIVRKGTPHQHLKSGLTSFEVICLISAMLYFLGVRVRVGFLLSFDKLNLEAGYRLDMYGTDQKGDIKKEIGKMKKEVAKNKNKASGRAIKNSQKSSKSKGKSSDGSGQEWSAHSDTEESGIEDDESVKGIKRKSKNRLRKGSRSVKDGNEEKEKISSTTSIRGHASGHEANTDKLKGSA